MTWLIVAIALVVIMVALALAAGALCEAELKRFGRRALRLPVLPGHGHHDGPMLPSETPPRTTLVRPGAHERTIPRKQTEGHSPWTGSQPVLTEDTGSIPDMDTLRREWDAYVGNEKRVSWARAELEALGENPTQTGAQRVYAGMRALSATPAEGFGVDRCEADVLEAERQAQGLIA